MTLLVPARAEEYLFALRKYFQAIFQEQLSVDSCLDLCGFICIADLSSRNMQMSFQARDDPNQDALIKVMTFTTKFADWTQISLNKWVVMNIAN